MLPVANGLPVAAALRDSEIHKRYGEIFGLGHSLFSAIIFASIATGLAKSQKLAVWSLSFFVVHLHILCDIAGAMGPDGYQWPIYYFYPLNSSFAITWEHQWELNAWPNSFIMVFLLLACAYYAATRRITFLEIFGSRLNEEAFNMYNKYVGKIFRKK